MGRAGAGRNRSCSPSYAGTPAVVDEQEQPSGWETLNQAVEEGLGLRIDPMQVLEHQDERLHLALAQQQTLHRVQDVLTALESVEMLPCRILDRYLQQRQEGWQSRPESLIVSSLPVTFSRMRRGSSPSSTWK